MSYYAKGLSTAKGWSSRKLYLSPEAVALMHKHCEGTPLTMSAYVDMLIKRDLGTPLRVEPGEFEELPKRPGGPIPGSAEDGERRHVLESAIRRDKQKQPTKKDFDLDV